MLKILKHIGLLIVSLIIAQMLMFYIFDDIIVHVTSSSIVFILGRLILAVIFWLLLFFVTSSKKQRKLLISGKLIFSIYIVYILFLISITLLKGTVISKTYNFIPFRFIFEFSEVNKSISILNIVSNLLMFLPLGIILYFSNKKVLNSLFIVIYTSLGIEVLQFLFKKGIFDIDDIILNTLGGLLGIFLFKYFLSPVSNKYIEMKS